MRLSPFHARWILAIMVILLAGLVAWIYWALGEVEHAAPKLRKAAPALQQSAP